MVFRLQTSAAEICFSLRYVPATQLLTVVVLEAKNLPILESGEYPGRISQCELRTLSFFSL